MSKESFWDLWEVTKKINTCIMGVPEEKGREAERLFKEIMIKNFTYLGGKKE